MRSITKKFVLNSALAVGALLTASASLAATVNLRTETGVNTTAGSAPVWRFVCADPAADVDAVCTPSTEGAPQITVAAGQPLTVNVTNGLPSPVSIVVPGQPVDAVDATPVYNGNRVQSFVKEVAGGGGTGSYTWSSLRPGTYLMHSGTQPSLQVPMGLFAALIVTDGTYPGSGLPEVVMLFSEIDPVQNARFAQAASGPATPSCVSLADYNASMGTAIGYPCTIDYSPSYYLVNGESAPNLAGLVAGDTILLRMLNAGLRTHTPSLVNLEMQIFAEDGNVYPGEPLRQSEALLAAGKTLDAIIDLPATTNLTIALHDRSPSFSDESLPTGGARVTLQLGDGTPPGPTATTQELVYNDVIEDTPYQFDPPGGNAVRIVASASHGSIEEVDNAGTRNFLYTPHKDFFGADAFTYFQPGNETTYYVTLNVQPVNDPPVGTADTYSNAFATSIVVEAPGVLGNDVDVDGDVLTATLEGAGPAGLVLNADGSFTYDGSAGTTFFEYRAVDNGSGDLSSDIIRVDLVSNPQSGIVLNVQDPDGTPVTEYRWLVQENRTFDVNPNAPDDLADQQSLNFHVSYMPVVAEGCYGCLTDIDVEPLSDPAQTDPAADDFFPGQGDVDFDGDGVYDTADAIDIADLALDPTKRYYVSVLPNDAGTGQGHTIGGAAIPALAAGAVAYDPVTVIVNPQEIPTAQISVYVFDDSSPTNGAPDASETGLGGFTVTVEDAGGRYGMSGGPMMQDAFGTPLTNSLPCAPPAAPGIVLSCDDGSVLIENLPPGKYGIVVTPPQNAQQWIQTSTIEGSPVVDAWVKAGEPPFFAEFGKPAPHVFMGFVDPNTTKLPADVEPGPNTITGNVTLLHDPRPPGVPSTSDSGSYAGLSHTRAWIGLNSVAGDGPNVATVQAAEDGSFSISGIPDGDYQVVVWDAYLDQIIAFQAFTLTGGTGADLGNVPVNNWFARVEHNVFLDTNENAIYDDGELPLPEQAVNLRWRDGTVNQSFPTDSEGFVPFDELFPFFHWQVWEVDYTRFKPTGMTTIVDTGGTVDAAGRGAGLMNSQYAPNTYTIDGSSTQRTETGATVLVQAWQGFPGQTSMIDWGKVPYKPGENGGISGIVSYGSTRGENDPRLTVMDPWEPGIPGVQVNLYREVQTDVPGETTLALVQSVTTDSWDDSLPTDCEGEVLPGNGDPFVDGTLGADNVNRCYDGWRNWNQVRPGVFDGGYAFNDIPPGNYVVEVVPPAGYEIIKEQNLNVGFGDAYGNPPATGFAPVSVVLPNGALIETLPDAAMVEAAGLEPGLAQPPCVGNLHVVPPELSLFPGEPAPFAYSYRPLCDRKSVLLEDQGQAAADFHLFTSTPVAAQFTGLITDDIAAETNRAAPGFGEKFSPAYLPFAIRDFNGRVVYHGYSDAFGHYNGILPSTFTANIPIPSGYSPAMMSACLNDPGDGATIDPLVNPAYGNACYTMQFMPGTTTYLDTPVLPQAGFAAGYNPPDCSGPDGTPVIAVVDKQGGGNISGPILPATRSGNGWNTIRITSLGPNAVVANPDYEGPLAANPANRTPTITRDLGFGNVDGTVTIGGFELEIRDWTADYIDAGFRGNAPAGLATGQLVVERGDNGKRSVNAVTVTISDETPIQVPRDHPTIQAAVDAANPGDLILVATGVYEEMVIMWKPVRLQGSGSSTIINAVSRPVDKLDAWQTRVEELVATNQVSLLPGQPTAGAPFAPGLLGNERGAGVTVLAKGGPGSGCGSASPDEGCFQVAGGVRRAARVDGFTITGGASGGGVFVNGWAHGLEISNNNVSGNSGALHGGIRVGHPYLPLDGDGPFGFDNGLNIHNNAVTRNGATGEQSAGGGISLSTGTNGYQVSNNFVCGNFAQGDGGGIAHLGLSNNGTIANNDILFNQSYNPGLTQSGGGLYIAGEPPAPPAVPGDQPELLSRGAGHVSVIANRIQGNEAGSGHGGGIRAERINGVEAVGVDANQRYRLLIDNNIIVNNLAAWSGGGVSLLDSARVFMRNNTIANNDTTATVGSLLATPGATSVPQPAGVSSQQHSLVLVAALATTDDPQTFSDPNMVNNIVWHNRAFYFDGGLPAGEPRLQPNVVPTAVGDCGTGADFWDIGVLGGAGAIQPRRSLLSSLTDAHGGDFSGNNNVAGDPDFLKGYCNGARELSTAGPIVATAALAEGGNFVSVRYGPLTQEWPVGSGPWDYHIGAASDALDSTWGGPATDFDGETRPDSASDNQTVDRGADER